MNPEDRAAAIEALADWHSNRVNTYATPDGITVKKLLTYGFKGFAAFSDKELIDHMMRIRDQHYQSCAILSRLAENELLK